MRYESTIADAITLVRRQLRDYGVEVKHDNWQGLPMQNRGPEWNHWEIMSASFMAPMPPTIGSADLIIKPNLPWAEDHFQERVGGRPLNPGDQYMNWPHWRPESEQVMSHAGDDQPIFTHTYMERFWPKVAGNTGDYGSSRDHLFGIRYNYGDLNDVVNLMLRDPYGRQAYLPIFFPEDTGAVHGGRIPCTLGYHFMLRENQLHMWYEIRSCDFIRHFRDDLYMAVRLAQWVLERLARETMHRISSSPELNQFDWATGIELGNLTFLAHSMHCFMGDRHAL